MVKKYDVFLRNLGKGCYCKAQTEDALYQVGKYTTFKYTPTEVKGIHNFDERNREWNEQEFHKRVDIIDIAEFVEIMENWRKKNAELTIQSHETYQAAI
jgi:sulfur transfer complex TusBCD TusB component (DsrH family)